MVDREKVLAALELCASEQSFKACVENHCPYIGGFESCNCITALQRDALALLKAQETRHRLEVHNIGNVDIPDGVSDEQFHAVMNNVVTALEHTDRGESWPYGERRDGDT